MMPQWLIIGVAILGGINLGFIFAAFIVGAKVYRAGREWELGKLRRLGHLTQAQYNRFMAEIGRGK